MSQALPSLSPLSPAHTLTGSLNVTVTHGYRALGLSHSLALGDSLTLRVPITQVAKALGQYFQ